MIESNYHTHIALCNHATGMPEDYVLEARKHSIKELGFSDHAHIPIQFLSSTDYKRFYLDKNMTLEQYYSIYLPELNRVSNLYKDISIKKGLEIEYIIGHEDYYHGLLANLDYLNLGIHFFCYKNNYYNSFTEVNYNTIYGYLDNAIEAMESKLFSCIVHPDLFLFDYKDKNGNNTFDSHCEYVTRKIIECAIKTNTYLEINARGALNSKRFNAFDPATFRYPNYEFWKIAKEYKDLKIIFGSDCHDPDKLWNSDNEFLYNFYKNLGIKFEKYMELKNIVR